MGTSQRQTPGFGASEIEAGSSREFFWELITGALVSLNASPSTLAVAYLTGLLEDRVRTPEPEACDAAEGTATLTEAFLTARSETGAVRAMRLRGVGDHALFVAGFFGESLERSAVGLDYYGEIGSAAYADLSASLAPREPVGFGGLFGELAADFSGFVEVLAEVGGQTRGREPTDLLRLYQRFVRSGSRRDLAQLLRRGLRPPPAEMLRHWQ